MDKYVILLPLYFNDGSPVPEALMQDAIDELYVLAGGYTLEGQVQGAYRMKSGKKQEDRLTKVVVMIAPETAGDLRTLVGRFCSTFQQECIWLEKANSTVELIEPDGSGGAL